MRHVSDRVLCQGLASSFCPRCGRRTVSLPPTPLGPRRDSSALVINNSAECKKRWFRHLTLVRGQEGSPLGVPFPVRFAPVGLVCARGSVGPNPPLSQRVAGTPSRVNRSHGTRLGSRSQPTHTWFVYQGRAAGTGETESTRDFRGLTFYLEDRHLPQCLNTF